MPLSFVRVRTLSALDWTPHKEGFFYSPEAGWTKAIPDRIKVPCRAEPLPQDLPQDEREHFESLRARGITETALRGYYEADHLVSEALALLDSAKHVVVSYLYTKPPDGEGLTLTLHASTSPSGLKQTTPIWVCRSKEDLGEIWWRRL